jgi:hypothetical protein
MLTKGIVGLAALIAGGFVTIDTVVAERGRAASERVIVVPQSDAAVGTDFKGLRQQANSALNVLLEREKIAQRAQAAVAGRPRCPEQTWPYYTADCLVVQNGVTAPTVRTVKIKNQNGIPRCVGFPARRNGK